jgi:hypothetical protein
MCGGTAVQHRRQVQPACKKHSIHTQLELGSGGSGSGSGASDTILLAH